MPPGEVDPIGVVTAMIAAVNDHDIERSAAFLSDDVALILRPEYPRFRDARHDGKDYFRKWLQYLFDRDFRIEIAIEKAEGSAVRTVTTTWMKTTKRLGVAPLVGFEDYVVKDGRIASLTWTTTDETRRKFVALRRRMVIVGAAALALVVVSAWWLVGR